MTSPCGENQHRYQPTRDTPARVGHQVYGVPRAGLRGCAVALRGSADASPEGRTADERVAATRPVLRMVVDRQNSVLVIDLCRRTRPSMAPRTSDERNTGASLLDGQVPA